MEIKQRLAKFALKQLGYTPVSAAIQYLTGGRVFSWKNQGSAAYNNKIVYSAVNILVNKLVEPSILVSRIKNEKSLNKYYSKSVSNEGRRVEQVKALEELQSHPLIDLLERPNSYQTGAELREAFWYNYIFGDGYLIALTPGEDSRSEMPIELHALSSNRVEPIISQDRYNPIEKYRITLFNGKQVYLDPKYVFHMSRWNPNDDFSTGFSPMIPAGAVVAKNDENQTAQGSAFINGGRGVMFSSDSQLDKDGNVVDLLPIESITALRETMMRDMSGAMNNQRKHFTNGKVNVTNYGDTIAEMELMEAEKADWRDIFAVLGIPIALGPTAEAMTDNNQEAGQKRLVTNTIMPLLKKFDMKFKVWCENWYGTQVIPVHDLTEFKELAPDLKLLKEVYADLPFIKFSEKRTLFQYDDDEENKAILERYYIQSGYAPLESLSEETEYVDPSEGEDYR